MKQNRYAHEHLSAYSQMTKEQIYDALGVGPGGLTTPQAEDMRERYGENLIIGEQKDSILRRFYHAFVNPFSVVLFLLAVISFFTDVLFVSNFSRNFTTVIIILCMLLLSGIVRFVQELRSKRITDRLTRLVDSFVSVRRDGMWQELPPEQLVVGDLVRIEAGDRVPADIRVIRAVDFFVSQSVITGESQILEKTPEPLAIVPESIADYSNTVFLGSNVRGGLAYGIVLAVGTETVYGGITPEGASRKRGFERGENSIAWTLIRFMALLVPIVFLACGLTKGHWLEAFLFALSVSTGLMPEMLPMVITACLTKSSSQMGQKGTVVKDINAMQGFGSMDVLCVDKTGTLTGDIVKLEYYMDVLGNESQRVLDCAYLNSYYHTGVSNHLDKAILRMEHMPGKEPYYLQLAEGCRKIDELPFDYNRRIASVLLEKDGQRVLIAKGSVDDITARCAGVAYHGARQDAGENPYRDVHALVDELYEDGMKVVAVAVRSFEGRLLRPEDEYGLTLLGYLAFFDAPKQSAASAIRNLHERHIAVKLLTGDNAEVAESICRRLGITSDEILTGVDVEQMDDNELPVRVENCTIFAELSPRHKSRIVQTLQENGHSVGFLGDGMNDLSSIIQADVGVSVDTATEAVKESADVILLRKDLNILDEGVIEGRKSFVNMSKYIRITASSNFGNILSIVIAGVLLPFFPITAVQLVLLNLLYDILCLVLPWDNVDEELYALPREWTGRNLGRFMLFFGGISSIFDVLTFIFLFFFLCPQVCGGSYVSLGADAQGMFVALFQTGWFLESLWSQILILHMLRTKHMPFVGSRASGPVLVLTVFGILVFTALTVTPLGTLLGLTAMPAYFYLFLILVVILYLLLVSCAKLLYIRKYKELV